MNDKIKRSIMETIKKNAPLAEESVTNFIAKCGDWAYEHNLIVEMSYTLYDVLMSAFGSWKTVATIVVEDEGYFKWSCLPEFNRDHSWAGKFDCLATMFRLCNEEYNLLDKYIPNVDFIIQDTRPWVEHGKFPACIYDDAKWGYSKNDAKKSGFPEDLYVAIFVSRNIYPQAIPADQETHYAFPPSSSLLTTVDKIKYQGVEVLCDQVEFEDAGIIYVSFKKAVDTIFKNVRFYGNAAVTLLPKAILEKYNLPILEI